MKIYWITSKLNFISAGGSVEEIDFMLTTLQKLGHDVTAFTAYSDANDITETRPYRVISKNFKSRSLITSSRECIRLMRELENEADVFIVDAHLFMYAAGWYRLRGGKTPVAGFVNQFLTCWPQYISSLFPREMTSILSRAKLKARWLVERIAGTWLASHVDAFAYVSPTLRRMYEDFGLPRRSADMVIGDPIDIATLRIKGNVDTSSYNKRLKKVPPLTLLFSSRMSPGKGFDMFLKGFSLVRNKKDFKVILGGTGPEEKYVKQMTKDLKLEEFVTIPGWVSKEQLFKYYREADVFIQADWWPAGTSISLIYALAFGVPSILPGGGGLQWNAGKGALYFPYRDAEALARCIERMTDAELRSQLSANCAARLEEDDMNYPKLIAEFSNRLQALKK